MTAGGTREREDHPGYDLDAALEIIDRDGIEALTMRRLGQALHRDPMALYRHAPNKASLLDGIAEIVLEQLTVDTTDPDWASQLRTVARGLPRTDAGPPACRAAAGHPTPGHPTRDYAQWAPCAHWKTSSTLLTRAGFSGPDALHIYRALFGFLHGHILNELQELIEQPDEIDDLLRLGLHRLPIAEFPTAPQPRLRAGHLRRRH